MINPAWPLSYDDVIKWKHFPRYWPSVRGIHRSPVNSPHKGQWRGALMFSLICWINDWVNNVEAGDLRRHRAHYDVTVMLRIKMVTTSHTLISHIGLRQYFFLMKHVIFQELKFSSTDPLYLVKDEAALVYVIAWCYVKPFYRRNYSSLDRSKLTHVAGAP